MRAILLFILAAPAYGACGTYAHCYQFAWHHLLAGGSSTANFAGVISGTYGFMAQISSGGQVNNLTTQTGGGASISVPADLIVTTDNACSVPVAWEFETYNSTTGATNLWINIGTFSNSVDTPVFVCAGKPSVTTWQGNVPGTWVSSALAVLHLANGSTLETNDSTSHANNGTPVNAPAAATGQVDGAVSVTSAGNDYVNLGTAISTSAVTYEVWLKGSAFVSSSGYNSVIAQYDGSNFILLYVKNNGKLAMFATGTGAAVVSYDGTGTNTLSTGTWYHVALTYSSAAGLVGYVNGAVDGTAVANGAIAVTAGTETDIATTPSVPSRFFDGVLDEVRIFNAVRSADAILSDYNTQLAPSSAYTVGPDLSGSTKRRIII